MNGHTRPLQACPYYSLRGSVFCSSSRRRVITADEGQRRFFFNRRHSKNKPVPGVLGARPCRSSAQKRGRKWGFLIADSTLPTPSWPVRWFLFAIRFPLDPAPAASARDRLPASPSVSASVHRVGASAVRGTVLVMGSLSRVHVCWTGGRMISERSKGANDFLCQHHFTC
jgi:hypothetical protein